ncbi:aminoglycoside phosphotransferase family protein [Dactylosporangium aurantiacum]|uniref:Aminoglycoside phosphotransferase family protein n=1 Tax=Dactylosporangium aurantiacum TaxID=35754 RepID=A0A9Q9MG25_9ACTN|nr:aminoglycoside phosphotransferase family protein [Dactylosporangium aurantiacum]MDG6100835.1 aminoglycoside phosphotransferase family protein [Dactylosporangium aurantiacum]UWZ55104.1 aminoglycoside phosphotransferase family protein [Dactylosporangium aurantiacum]
MTDQDVEEELAGGGVNRVVRVGATVRRPAGAWSPRIHQLFEHLQTRGFTGAPRSFGTDALGRDVFEFLPGEVGHDPWTPAVAGDAALVSAGRLLRAYHDATTDVAASWRDGWQKPAVEPVEVICHNDVAPYNCVYDGERVVGLIDFDVAAPGPRAWDLAYAIYRFVPLGSAAGPRAGERLAMFFDAYGADEPLRRAARAAVVPRLRDLTDHMRAAAAAGDEAFAAHIARGDLDHYLKDMALLSG